MKKTILLLLITLISLLLIAGCSSQITTVDIPTFEKQELAPKEQAKNFGLEVVKTYFNKDCDAYFDALSDKIYTLEDDSPITKEDKLKERLCESIKNAVKGDHTFEEYLSSYEIRALDKAEYETEFPFLSKLKNFKASENDFLFYGAKSKNSEKFMWDYLLVFMVRKEGKNFKVVVLSG